MLNSWLLTNKPKSSFDVYLQMMSSLSNTTAYYNFLLVRQWFYTKCRGSIDIDCRVKVHYICVYGISKIFKIFVTKQTVDYCLGLFCLSRSRLMSCQWRRDYKTQQGVVFWPNIRVNMFSNFELIARVSHRVNFENCNQLFLPYY